MDDALAHINLTIEVGEVFWLDEVADAHRLLEAGHARGKVVLDLRA